MPERTRVEAKILDGARRCFLLYGPDKVSISEVCTVAGVSRQSLYNYFTNRERLLDVVIDLTGRVFAEDLSQAMGTEERFEDQIGQAVVVMLAWLEGSKRHFGTPGYGRLVDVFRPHSEAAVVPAFGVVRPYVERALRTGAVRRDLKVDRATEWIVHSLLSLMSFSPRTFDPESTVEMIAFVQEHLVRGLD